MIKWNYGDFYKKYDMKGEIKIGTGIIKVHDLFNPLPEFMKQADAIFCDPPCSKINIKTFYTKADMLFNNDYLNFVKVLFENIKIINPKILFLEVFKSNKNLFIDECKKLYKNIEVKDSCYYHNTKNKCWILICSNDEIPNLPDNIDEQDFIQWICENINYNCIGDLCIGRGLVGFYSNKYGKNFVGTELNKKRLAVLIERINKNKLEV